MRITDAVADYLKIIFLTFKKFTYRPKSLNELHKYWRKPSDGSNLPQDYLEVGTQRSQFLLELIIKYGKPNSSILEIGCNVGRNLNCLYINGFRELHGIEINEEAIQLLKQTYPQMASLIKIYNAPVEDVIGKLQEGQFDIIFTMAVLEHIHTSSEWIFSYIVRTTNNYLITIEDERGVSWRHFPRDYKKVFEPLGMKQIEVINCGTAGLSSDFFARVFKKI